MPTDESLLHDLKNLIGQVDDCCCGPCGPCAPCGPCGPCKPCGTCPCPANGFTSQNLDKPFVQCCITIPPPGPLPLYPEPVKPLQLPCPSGGSPQEKKRCPEEDFQTRYSNFYNNYNVDWHNPGNSSKHKNPCCPEQKSKGATVDGQNPCCEDYTKKKKKEEEECPLPGCPTGFKPCTMKMIPPSGCDPCGVWYAQVQQCPPKPKKKVSSNQYVPGPCTRPCCKHWKPKGGPCLYDKPCKAHCLDHPPGIKPSSAAS